VAKKQLKDSLQTQTTHSKTSEIDERSKQATIYFFNRLKDIYLSKFSQAFKTEEALKAARREWVHDIGQLSREQIDTGMDKIKRLCMVKNSDFDWPNVALTIGVCRGDYADSTPKTAEQQRLKTIIETDERTVAREFRLNDTAAKDRAKEAREKQIGNIRAILAG